MFRYSFSETIPIFSNRHEGFYPCPIATKVSPVIDYGLKFVARSIQPKFPEISVNGSVRSNRKSFEKTGPPFDVDHFSRSDRLELWLNGSRPKCSLTKIDITMTTITKNIGN